MHVYISLIYCTFYYMHFTHGQSLLPHSCLNMRNVARYIIVNMMHAKLYPYKHLLMVISILHVQVLPHPSLYNHISHPNPFSYPSKMFAQLSKVGDLF